MSATHTPGPWKVDNEPTDDGTFFVIGDTGQPIVLAEVLRGSFTFPDCLPAKANARLIAAAPDLLTTVANGAGHFDAIMEYLSGACTHTPERPGRDCYTCDAYASARRGREAARAVLAQIAPDCLEADA